jgi:hypothetical protein
LFPPEEKRSKERDRRNLRVKTAVVFQEEEWSSRRIERGTPSASSAGITGSVSIA